MEKDQEAKFTIELRDEVVRMIVKLSVRNEYDRIRAEEHTDEKEKNQLLVACDARDEDARKLKDYYNFIKDICQKNGF